MPQSRFVTAVNQDVTHHSANASSSSTKSSRLKSERESERERASYYTSLNILSIPQHDSPVAPHMRSPESMAGRPFFLFLRNTESEHESESVCVWMYVRTCVCERESVWGGGGGGEEREREIPVFDYAGFAVRWDSSGQFMSYD